MRERTHRFANLECARRNLQERRASLLSSVPWQTWVEILFFALARLPYLPGLWGLHRNVWIILHTAYCIFLALQSNERKCTHIINRNLGVVGANSTSFLSLYIGNAFCHTKVIKSREYAATRELHNVSRAGGDA